MLSAYLNPFVSRVFHPIMLDRCDRLPWAKTFRFVQARINFFKPALPRSSSLAVVFQSRTIWLVRSSLPNVPTWPALNSITASGLSSRAQ